MTIQELFRSVTFASVWDCLAQEYGFSIHAFPFYRNAFEKLRDMPAAPIQSKTKLVVARVRRYCKEPEYIYVITFQNLGDSTQHSLLFSPWDRWLCHPILQSSLAYYGGVEVAAHILFSMTSFGFSHEGVKHGAARELKKRLDFGEERRAGCGRLPLDKLCEEMCIAPEGLEGAQPGEWREEVLEENRNIYAILLKENQAKRKAHRKPAAYAAAR